MSDEAKGRRDASRNEVDEACMNYRNDFGLMTISEANALRLEALYWLQAWNEVNMAEKDVKVASRQDTNLPPALGVRLLEYYEPHEVELWLTRPQPLLDGKTAIQIMAEGKDHLLHRVLDGLDCDQVAT